MNFDDEEQLIAEQILGSLDQDGYFRREIEAVVDNIAFNEGVLTSKEKVEQVRREIQRLDPPGIASKDLQDCLQAQLELMSSDATGRNNALEIIKNHWDAFEKKHFSKLKNKLGIDDEALKDAFSCIRGLDPKPGGSGNAVDDNKNYIEPDFEVIYKEYSNENGEQSGEGDFVITLNNQNVPALKISPRYKEMWEDLKKKIAETKKPRRRRLLLRIRWNRRSGLLILSASGRIH